MNDNIIKTEEEYKNYLKQLSWYFDNQPEEGTPEADQFKQIVKQVIDYENRIYGGSFN